MATERSPLLPGDPQADPEAARDAGPVKPSDIESQLVAPVLLPDAQPWPERRRSLIRWSLFWLAVALFLGIMLYLAIRNGGGQFDWKESLKKAGGGGLSGALAMIVQVLTLMPLRTIMNYQYRYGGTMTSATSHLYSQGFSRFYSGLGAALFQGPIARFGDTAANAGILALLSSNPFLKQLPSPLKTVFASAAGALFRMVLVPIDTLKTTLQTQGQPGIKILRDRIKAYGVGTLWYGAWATAAASFVGSYPWFATYNWLNAGLGHPNTVALRLLRQAFIGFVASLISDTVSNSLRVLKTYRQVHQAKVSYGEAAKRIIQTEGYLGLFGRGLKTRIACNGLQGLLFAVLWKLFQDLIEKKKV